MDLVARAKNIVTAPKTEWSVIASEATSPGTLFSGYVAPLAAIPPVATIIGNLLFGRAMTFGESVAVGIIGFVIALVGVWVLGLIASKIAPSFGGKDDLTQGLKLVGYAYTAAWVAGIFNLVPALAILAIIGGIYSLYLLYTGGSVMMSVPRDRSGSYTVVVILVAIGLYIVIGIVVGVVIAAVSLVR